MQLKTRLVSSLEKCFLDDNIESFAEVTSEKIFANQRYTFQLLYECPNTDGIYFKPEIESDISNYITLREVVNIPSDMPVYSHSDDQVLRREPGLYPDLLRPLKYNGTVAPPANVSRALWITVDPLGQVRGTHKIKIKLKNAVYVRGLTSDGNTLAEEEFTLTVADAFLPPQQLIFGQWFYADCIADHYNVPVFSDRHFEICEQFIKTAVKGGRNMILLPLLTYSLDIHHEGYRTTVQLVDIFKEGNSYRFGYENLDKWLEMCKRQGIEYYEVCHLFSQWGATAAPKVMAWENGEYKRIFGWKTDPLSDEYKTFLRAFIGGFIEHMKARGEDKKCWFHISDEPVTEHLPQFKAVKAIIADLIKDYHHIDALSHFEFYEQGLIDTPIPATCAIEPFIKHNVPDLWCYYCGGHARGVSNCHFAMSLSRTRFIGVQMFKYNIKGFLNWGYNFYNDQWSYDTVDPFLSSTGEGFSASGDTYMVYPAPDGTAWESNRFNAFYEGIEDMRALQLLESLTSHEEAVKAVEDIVGEVVFDKCVADSATMLKLRRTINQLIFDKLGR